MFKKLASLLFEEEEIIDEPVEEKVDLKRVKKPAEPIKTEPDFRVGFEPEQTEKPRKSSFENIVVDEPKTEPDLDFKQPAYEERKEPVRHSEPAFADRKPVYTKDVYEFKPVISPMFGIAESEKEHVRPTFVQTAEVKNDSHLQTVISPYYGAIRKDMKTGPEHPAPVVMEPTYTVKAKVAEYVEEAKPAIIENIPLEALIAPTPIIETQVEKEETHTLEEKPEDVTQFSLFGEE